MRILLAICIIATLTSDLLTLQIHLEDASSIIRPFLQKKFHESDWPGFLSLRLRGGFIDERTYDTLDRPNVRRARKWTEGCLFFNK